MKRRTPIILLLFFLIIGFAAVTTTIIINSNATLGFNESDFKVIFSSASSYNGNVAISNDNTTISYNSELLSQVGDYSTITYTVTNASLLYDANITLNITDLLGNNITSDYFTITETKQLPSTLGGTSSAEGEIKIELINTPMSTYQYNFKVTIDAIPIERTNSDLYSTLNAPGLYDSNGDLVASWNTLVNIDGLDIENGTVTLSNIQRNNNEYSQVETVIVPEGVDNINLRTFQYSKTLKTLYLPSTYNNFTEAMFDGCNGLENVNISENNPYYSSIDGVVFNKDQTTLLLYPEGKSLNTYTIPDIVETISSYAFEDANIQRLNIPVSVRIIEEEAFCNSTLQYVYFDNAYNWNTSESSVANSDISRANNAATYLMNNAEYEWTNNSYAGLYDKDGVFLMSWETLTQDYGVDFDDKPDPRFFDSDDDYDETFYIFHELNNDKVRRATKLIVGDDIDYIGSYSLAESSLEEIILSNSITIIHEGGFYHSKDLKNVTLSENLITIGSFTFMETSVEHLVLPNSLQAIKKQAFNFSQLSSVTIPASVTLIEEYALESYKLSSVTFENPNGWKYNGVAVDASIVSNPTTMAGYFKTSHSSGTWTRSDT